MNWFKKLFRAKPVAKAEAKIETKPEAKSETSYECPYNYHVGDSRLSILQAFKGLTLTKENRDKLVESGEYWNTTDLLCYCDDGAYGRYRPFSCNEIDHTTLKNGDMVHLVVLFDYLLNTESGRYDAHYMQMYHNKGDADYMGFEYTSLGVSGLFQKNNAMIYEGVRMVQIYTNPHGDIKKYWFYDKALNCLEIDLMLKRNNLYKIACFKTKADAFAFMKKARLLHEIMESKASERKKRERRLAEKRREELRKKDEEIINRFEMMENEPEEAK